MVLFQGINSDLDARTIEVYSLIFFSLSTENLVGQSLDKPQVYIESNLQEEALEWRYLKRKTRTQSPAFVTTLVDHEG